MYVTSFLAAGKNCFKDYVMIGILASSYNLTILKVFLQFRYIKAAA